ncbi:hypothetical protein VTN77DRAFT_8391 [Rasamsonia byssochlamydoides]|uniref:uncharacterized protein n=1 Tax=Rasamsonia byssochlamydoides TaxID=89139 RepID=UPI003742F251
MAPRDQPDPSTNKSSLLWAYHLRQENIHLVDQIDSIGAELVSANKKTLAVQQGFSDLATLVKTLQAENHELRDETRSLKEKLSETIELALQIRTELGSSLESVILRVKALEDDDVELQAALGNFENKYASILQKHVEGSRVPLGKVSAEEMRYLQGNAGRELSQEPEDMRHNEQDANFAGLGRPSCVNTVLSSQDGHCENPQDVSVQDNREESITMIPNSMPSMHDSILPSPQPPSTQQVTWLGNVDTGTESRLPSKPSSHTLAENQKTNPEGDLKCLKQNKQSLAAYFLMAENIRSQLPRRKQEGIIVEAFYEGLRDGNIKSSLERSLETTGWTWNTLERFCRQCFSQEKINMSETQDATTGIVQWPQYGKRKTKTRKRRHISLGPLENSDKN